MKWLLQLRVPSLGLFSSLWSAYLLSRHSSPCLLCQLIRSLQDGWRGEPPSWHGASQLCCWETPGHCGELALIPVWAPLPCCLAAEPSAASLFPQGAGEVLGDSHRPP